jgi:regulatory protein
MQEQDFDTAYARAIRFIQYRPRSVKEVVNKMKTLGFDETVIDKVVARLEEDLLLNDESFARDWAVAKAHSQLYVRNKIRSDLTIKGINGKTVDLILNEVYNTEHELDIALRWLSKKYAHRHETDDDKLIQALVRHGFDYSISKKALARFRDHDHKE